MRPSRGWDRSRRLGASSTQYGFYEPASLVGQWRRESIAFYRGRCSVIWGCQGRISLGTASMRFAQQNGSLEVRRLWCSASRDTSPTADKDLLRLSVDSN